LAEFELQRILSKTAGGQLLATHQSSILKGLSQLARVLIEEAVAILRKDRELNVIPNQS
jgi:hypothetical protein